MKKLAVTSAAIIVPMIITYIASATALTHLTSISFIIGTIGLICLIYGFASISSTNAIKTAAIMTLYSGIFIELMDLTCIFKSGRPFNNDFVQHFNPTALTLASATEIASICYMLVTVLILAGFAFFYYRKNETDSISSSKSLALGMICSGLALTICFANPIYDFGKFMYGVYFKYNAEMPYNEMLMPSAGIKTCDVDYDSLKAKSGKNLVFIYLESLEGAFTNEKIFPDLTPNINKLRNEGISFDNIECIECARCTIAAIYVSMSGCQIPPCHGIPGTDRKTNDLYNLIFPQILTKANYRQIMLYGYRMAQVGGVDTLMNNVGIQLQYPIDQNGKQDLPTCDEELFNLGIKTVDKYSKFNRPYNVMMITSDSHMPGNIKPEWEPYDVKKMKNAPNKNNANLTAVKHTDKVFGEFIEKLKQRPDWNNMIVFVMSDHIILPGTCTDLVNRNRPRNMLMFALGGGIEPKRVTTKGATYDAAPTVLQLMGVKSNYVFPIGESLLGYPSALRLNNDNQLRYECLAQYIEHRRMKVYNKQNSCQLSLATITKTK